VPQESTRFSPFELLYGRDVRGSLDVLKKAWELSPSSDKSTVSYGILMQERLEKMTTLVQTNMAKAQGQQKHWYDRWRAREPSRQGTKSWSCYQHPRQSMPDFTKGYWQVPISADAQRRWHLPPHSGYFSSGGCLLAGRGHWQCSRE